MMRILSPLLAICIITSAVKSQVTTDRFQLENGIRVVSVRVPDATKQSIFCFFPLHLANDPANRTQWAHLVEHMLIRSTDPDNLNPPGMMLNGETIHNSMRLEMFVDPEHWKPAVEKLGRWLAAREFDAQTLEREKINIAAEEQGTVQMGATGKWAIAAWNQVVRHGAKDVALHGDVAGAKLEELHAYAKQFIPIDSSVTLATVGPVDADQFKAEVERVLGAIKQTKTEIAPASAVPFQPRRAFEATWDLPTTHVMQWWQLPKEDDDVRAAAAVLHLRLSQWLYTNPALQKIGARGLVFADVRTPEGTFFIIDFGMKRPVADFNVDELMQEALGAARDGNEFDAGQGLMGPGAHLALQLGSTPDFASLRRSVPSRHGQMIEGQWMLTRTAYEYAFNKPVDDIAAALNRLTAASFTELVHHFHQTEPGSLVLKPVGPP